MSGLRAVPGKGDGPWHLIDLYAGCGGASAGFLASGSFVHHYAADNDRWAAETYRANLGFEVDQRDLGGLASKAALRRWADEVRPPVGVRSVLVGCAPCQGFSSHVKVRGDRRRRNFLLETLGDLAVAVGPDVVFVENVPDLFAERNWSSFERLRASLEDGGYRVRAKIVNLAQLGVPQERFRAVVIASRDRAPSFPAPLHAPEDFSTVGEWIGDLPALQNGACDPGDPMHQASRHRADTVRILEQVPLDGGSRPAGVGPKCLDDARSSFGGYTDVYGRLRWDKPAPTITARCRTPSCGRFVHPEQHRGLTAREAALLQTFPRTWQFVGPFDDRYKQIGNAVPPLAAEAFARHIVAMDDAKGPEVGEVEIEDRPIGTSFSVLIPGIRRQRLKRQAA